MPVWILEKFCICQELNLKLSNPSYNCTIKFQTFHAVHDKLLGLFLQEQNSWSPKLACHVTRSRGVKGVKPSCISEFCCIQNIGCILAIGLCVNTTVHAIETYLTVSKIVLRKYLLLIEKYTCLIIEYILKVSRLCC